MRTFIPILVAILVLGTFFISSKMNVEEIKTKENSDISEKIDTPKIKTQKEDTSKIDTSLIIGGGPISARFKGGDKEWRKFLSENLKYPTGLTSCIEGTVYVRLMIDTDGSVMKNCVKIAKSLEKSFDEEAMRVVKLMPNWTPGMWNNKPIKQRIRVPIKFKRNR